MHVVIYHYFGKHFPLFDYIKQIDDILSLSVQL